METWDIYDVHRQPKGRTHIRGTKVAEGDYRMIVHVVIFNTQGQMLIQQRQSFKQGWSNLWDVSAGGSVASNETSQEGIHRELWEELGYDYDFSKQRPKLTFNFEHGFDDWYVIEKDIDMQTLHLQYEEVQNVRWATLDEIYAMIRMQQFVAYHPEIFAVLFAMRNSYGAHACEELKV